MLDQLIWRPMESAPIDPREHIWVLTTHGNVELAAYQPDRHLNAYGLGNCTFNAIAWTPLVKPTPPIKDHGDWLVDSDPSFKR